MLHRLHQYPSWWKKSGSIIIIVKPNITFSTLKRKCNIFIFGQKWVLDRWTIITIILFAQSTYYIFTFSTFGSKNKNKLFSAPNWTVVTSCVEVIFCKHDVTNVNILIKFCCKVYLWIRKEVMLVCLCVSAHRCNKYSWFLLNLLLK